ncbi:hypothetical protein C8R47DRAFT_1315893 [Mycena vitilis]|nr:hypothetical protein C8R47DRAFT_1315893 [Mycena vitilis]
MHPAFSQNNFAALPPTIRRTATLAFRGSVENLERLHRLIDGMSPAQSTACLPAFYANLDVKSIPTPSEMDTCAPLAWAHPVNCAGVSMYSLYRLQIPIGAFPDLWPRLWQWVQFYHTYCHHFVDSRKADGRSRIDPGTICQDFVRFVGSFHSSKDILDLMLATPGFRYIVTRAWVSRLNDAEELSLSAVYPDVSRLILETSETMQPAHIQELIDGAGGHYTDFASLMIRYINAVLPTRESPSLIAIDLLGCIVDFLPGMDSAFERRAPGKVSPSPEALGEALLAQGLVGALTSIMYAVSDVFEPGGTLLEDCAQWLIGTLSDPRWHSLIAEALDAGLLYSIASCIADGGIPEQVTAMLETILPWSLTFCRNVKRLKNGVLQAEPVLVTEEFQNSKLAPLWRAFLTSANERVLVMYDFNAGAGPDRRACDNIKCAQIRKRRAFRRCAGCLSFYYCSAECQHIDWRDGGHRAACTPGSSFHLGEQQHDLNVRQRAFLRAVLLQDYKEGQWSTVAAQHLSFMAKHPGEAYFTLFDYRRGRVEISVHPVSGFAGEGSEPLTASAEWKNDVARAAQSGERLEIHVMVIPQGKRSRYLVVPLHSNNVRKQNTLKTLARLGLKEKDIPELVRGVQLSAVPDDIFTY